MERIPMNRSFMIVLTIALCAACSAAIQPPESTSADANLGDTSIASDEAAVKAVVNRFLIAI